MNLTRKHRILTALVALFGMLFMQLAVAAYSCPGLQASSDALAEVMIGCEQSDPAEPALCQAHCQDGKSSLDKPQPPAVSPAAVIVSTILSPLEPEVSLCLPGAQPASFLQRSTAPPVSIRNCCLRI